VKHLYLRLAFVAVLVALTATLAAGASAKATKGPKGEGRADFLSLGDSKQGNRAANAAFPSFSFSYTDPTDHITYPITVIGSDPRQAGNGNFNGQGDNGDARSKVRTVIIPLRMHFVAAGQDTSVLNDIGYVGFRATPLSHTFDGGRRVEPVLRSPIFSQFRYPSDMGGDRAQFGDAFMRAQFNKIGTDYHVAMSDPQVTDVQTVDVPAADGIAYQRPVGAWRTAHGMPTDTITGVADVTWFSNYIIDVMTKLHIGPDVIPIFLTDNVLLYDTTYDNCCILGFHGTPSAAASPDHKSVPAAQQTLMYAAWTTPGTYSGFMTDYTGTRSAPSPTRGLADIHALSHEVAEAFDDPFVNNAVTPWLTPTAPQYGCTPVLEVGDPVVGVWFPLDGNRTGNRDGFNYYGQYHPEDNVFGEWFAHGAWEAMGLKSWDGRLTFMGPRTTGISPAYAGFGTYSQGC
jgi:hypothetical protein